MAVSIPTAYVRLARYCGKMIQTPSFLVQSLNANYGKFHTFVQCVCVYIGFTKRTLDKKRIVKPSIFDTIDSISHFGNWLLQLKCFLIAY